jgi:hypothetical protein
MAEAALLLATTAGYVRCQQELYRLGEAMTLR